MRPTLLAAPCTAHRLNDVFDFLRKLFRSTSEDAPQAASASQLDLADITAEWLVVGLGNPGAKYEPTKHNVGFMALDELTEPQRVEPIKGINSYGVHAGDAFYLKPLTFMNLSGEAVEPAATQLGIEPDHVIVVHDELDLPAGTVRIKLGGNENGHNGLKSVTEHLGTRDYVRVRIGIGRPPQGVPVIDWVLGPVQDEDISAEAFQAQIETAAQAIQIIVDRGVQAAQNEIHSR